MPFSDLVFIFIFLPVFVVLYRAVPRPSLRAPLLLAGGIAFYAAGLLLEPPASIVSAAAFPAVLLYTWLAGRAIGASPGGGRGLLDFSTALLVGLLALFKYFAPPVPPGMSFYIFTAIAYLADVSGGKSPSGSFIGFGAYFAFFPKLLSGPISRWEDFRAQLDTGDEQDAPASHDIAEGMRLFISGLAEKVILADTIGRLWIAIIAVGVESISTPVAWLGAAAFSMRLYFDFDGYSTMARGAARMLGIELPVNFDHPYMSRSVSEFWRRWHITLGTWFRDYVYIPLGGSRRGRAALVFNLFVVWTLTGVWHGATLNFLLWGLALFALVALEKLFIGSFLEKHRVISHIYLLAVIPVTWMLFANTDTAVMTQYFSRMFSFSGGLVGMSRFLRPYALSLTAGVLCCTPLPSALFAKVRGTVAGSLIYAALLAGSVYMIWLSGSGPFMYFSF